jgi:ubiquinone/menaquinone biosynthesis C-methylase UbiE
MNKNNNNESNKVSWDAYQEDYMEFHLKSRPNYFEFFSNGGVDLDDYLISLLGDVRGLKMLDTCCACDAVQAFSWHNLGARVTACDIAPKAIKIAKSNAIKMGLDIDFVITDMQTLDQIGDNQFDIVFATYPVWVQDIKQACKTWNRVLKHNGRLLLSTEHPITYCISQDEDRIHIRRDYNKPSREIFEIFQGTPLADRFGGWSVVLPSVENFYRMSDLINAVISADLSILAVHESSNADDESEMKKLPCDFTILAVK